VALFYLDHNVAVGIGNALINLGHQAATARQLRLAGATDATHLLTAVRQNAVLITNDLDFLALQPAWREWAIAWGVTPAPVHHGILLISQGQMGGAAPAASSIHAHISGSLILSNTLWRWTTLRGWFIP
jgi:hypothetical protein